MKAETRMLRAFAEAFSAFGNDAIGAMHHGTAEVACIASGMQAVAWRLEEIAKESAVDLFPRPPHRAVSINCSEGIVSVHFDSDDEARSFFEGLHEEGELERLTRAVVDTTRRAEKAERDLGMIEEAFVAVCNELGCEPDNEGALIAVHELRERKEKAEAVADAAEELLTVSDLRGDAGYLEPSDDPKLWTARRNDAWSALEEAIVAHSADKDAGEK